MIISSGTAHPLFDFPAGWFVFYIGGSVILLILVIVIVFLEGLVLQKRNYGSLKRSLAASLGMNLVSSILGYLAARFVEWQPIPGEGMVVYYAGVYRITEWFFKSGSTQLPQIPALLFFLAISWIISTISEGLVLTPRKRLPLVVLWGAIIEANIYSYILLTCIFFLWPVFPETPVVLLQFLIGWWWLIIIFIGTGILIGFPSLRATITRTPWRIIVFGALSGLFWGIISYFVFYENGGYPSVLEKIICLPSMLIKGLVPFQGSWYLSATMRKFAKLSLLSGGILGITLAAISIAVQHIRSLLLSQIPESKNKKGTSIEKTIDF
jgi:hypothetical protein